MERPLAPELPQAAKAEFGVFVSARLKACPFKERKLANGRSRKSSCSGNRRRSRPIAHDGGDLRGLLSSAHHAAAAPSEEVAGHAVADQTRRQGGDQRRSH